MLGIIRIFLAVLWFFTSSAAALLVAIFRPFNLKNALLFCRIAPPMARKILGIEFEIRNHERMLKTHPCVIVANHQHALDLLIFAECLRVPATSLGKKELKYVPFYGWLYWLSDQILIDRKNKQKAIESVNVAAGYLNHKNASVWIFPEGTRIKGKELGPFKKGAFHLAIQAQRPILPLAANTFPSTLNFNKWKSGKIVIQVMEPIETKGLTEKDIDALMIRSRNSIADQIQKLDAELAATL